MPASSPYTKTPLAIPHLSAGGLDFLLEDFATSFIRRLGSVNQNGQPNHTVGNGTNTSALAVALVDDQTHLELKYYRLSHTRALKESYRFNIWQAQTFLGKAPPTQAGGGWINRGDGLLQRVLIVGRVVPTDDVDTVRDLILQNINEPVVIDAPIETMG